MSYYTFHQNNSGGCWITNENVGLGEIVIVEASTALEANYKLIKLGGYFDPDFKRDCDCCGNRWSPVTELADADSVPSIYGMPIEPGAYTRGKIFVHSSDGSFKLVDENWEHLLPTVFVISRLGDFIKIFKDSDEAWEYVQFHDPDFMSITEVAVE